LLQTVVSQDVTRQNFSLIPDLIKYEGTYTDEMLRKKWDINEEEWEYIDSKIKATELMGNRKNEDNE
ncbi:MAG TPA: restriction endonuclease, partial [Flavobacterium sp.]|nr:restriction endonuclease [Flavobacterium sp.]